MKLVEALIPASVAKKPLTSFSTIGPECPFCEAMWATDEASYFDENGFDLKCEECGTEFRVTPSCSWMWRSVMTKKGDK